MPHFFISYAKKDTRDLALTLSDSLNTFPNISAWVDRSLKAGKSWELQIQTEIEKCDYFVVLYSPDINRHKQGEEESYVLTEIHYAKRELKKPIIPVMAQKTTPPMSLTTLHYIDYTLSELSLEDLLKAICEVAGIQFQAALKAKDILPAPFDWCEIPAGKVSLQAGGYVPEGGQTFDVPAFRMAKYPVTNAQYAKFIEAGGYQNEAWWTEAGWQAKEAQAWTEPRYWSNERFIGDAKPIVSVSWYEAIAFCQWLSETTDEVIGMPTEQQWQRAAQGDDGRIYPWGKDWDCERCNNSVTPCDSEATSLVTAYPNGASPYGVFDMAGNVWEWCLTDYDTGNYVSNEANVRTRSLRGASWGSYDTNNFRSAYRDKDSPANWEDCIGFRLFRFNPAL